MRRSAVILLTMLLVGGMAAGCATVAPQPQADSSAILPQEVLAALEPGEGDFAPDQVYRTAQASAGRYDKILLDPLLYFAPLDQMRLVSPGDRQVLLNNFYILLSRELAKDFTLVRFPQEGAARVQFAVLPATPEPVAMDTVSMVVPGSGGDEVVRDTLASPLLKGRDFVVEAEWTDSLSGAVLGATVDRHFGRQAVEGDRLKSWADVNRVLQDYAVLIRYRLCRFRGAADCVQPPDSLR